MRPVTYASAALVAALSIGTPGECLAVSASPDSLYQSLSRKPVVRVHVETPSDATQDRKADPARLKAQIEDALKTRKSIRFETVPDAAAADLVISCQIAELVWMDRDPVDMLAGVGAAAMDAAVGEHYARLQANVVIRDAKNDKILWSEKVKATVTSNAMTPETYVKTVGEDLAKVLTIRAFGKRRSP